MFMPKEIRAMKHIMTFSSVFLWVVMMSLPAFAGDIPNPENVEIVDAWLTSDPQPGVRYHILRVCEGPNVLKVNTCTKCIYKAKENGAMWIPANNRCLVRINDDDDYQPDNFDQIDENHCLFYQIKSADGDETSSWSAARVVKVERTIINTDEKKERTVRVQYFPDKISCD